MEKIYYNSNGVILENSKILFDVDQTTTTTTTTKGTFSITKTNMLVTSPVNCNWVIYRPGPIYSYIYNTNSVNLLLFYPPDYIYDGRYPIGTNNIYATLVGTIYEDTFLNNDSNTIYWP